jgi:AcrR family transcriptional regulator
VPHAPATRRRGRPPKSDDPSTRDRLLDAAAEACIEVGFDAVTVADVARRAGVTPAAVYNHFADKAALLYAAGRLAIDQLNANVAATGDPARAANDVAAAFLDPSFAANRRLIVELHIAGARHPELASHLADWHREFAGRSAVPAGNDAEAATVKAFFLLLLGLCHLDDLDAIETPAPALRDRVDQLVDVLYPP